MDRRIKFRHLEAFVSIARAKRLKRAAQQMNLTQPAISKTLRDLEVILGVSLMERDRAGVRLTPEGHVFLQYAEQSTAALQQGISSIASLSDAGGAVLKIGALPSVSAQVLPTAIERFRQESPNTILHIEEGAHGLLTDRLRSGDLDLVIGRLGAADTMRGLSFTALYNERVVAVVAPDHSARDATQLNQIENELVIYPPETSAIRPLMARLMLSRGLPLFADRIECVSGAFGRAMTLGPLMPVWFISRGVVADDLNAGRLVALDIDMGPTDGAVGIMARSEENLSPLVGLFSRAVSQDASSLRRETSLERD
ncbi:HTH-type transcriptional regulator BenM (plasmid) [Sulfitobacter sp. DSM 110093]|uniref:pca operon transcription factor PcaQ n=1 Tax=Sulfitobacter sp. DSM 110093 TaxID=2883127 RepID=UPI001FAE0E56|nr:pca operon transcription factor PcaQ [Sulfitobacter sp. DSM 110093]UOA34274.1 HTH-type transcriptional regulator BenM [Sulfitobacter sp. DSM 110093]